MDKLAEAITWRFDDFLLDTRIRALFRLDAGRVPIPVPVGSRAVEILCFLIEHGGALASKQAIMDAVWPNVAVEENNLTVQISALRHALDERRAQGSCIQTIPGRGYRFLPQAFQSGNAITADAIADLLPPEIKPAFLPQALLSTTDASPANQSALPRRRPRRATWAVALCLLAAALFAAHAWYTARSPATAPRFSLVVLPFENLSGNPAEDALADGITDDLTSDLAHLYAEAFVIARESAYAYKGKSRDVRRIGEDLGVRYALEGSVRKLGTTLRVNIRLISAETGVQLWSDRFDEPITEPAAGQQQTVAQMSAALRIQLVEIENARSLRERPDNPDAFDLILRARSLQLLPQSLDRDKEVLALYERALSLDPSSVSALVWVAYFRINGWSASGWGTFDNMRRAERLLARAHAIAPDSPLVLNMTVYWLGLVGRCQEVIEVTERAIQMDPHLIRAMTGVYTELGKCKTQAGHAEEELALQEKANQLNPLNPWRFVRYRHMGFASLLLGRDQDAITFLQRSLAIKPEVDNGTQWHFRLLAAAYARTGQMAEAKHFLSEANRLWPYDTVRGHDANGSSNAVYVEQIKSYQAALRLAGERDHADEDADFGVPTDHVLHGEFAGLTPKDAPGVRTIRTMDLARFLVDARPVVIDTMTYSWGRSLPGATGLKFAGMGGSFTDTAQDPLRSKMRELTDGDLNRPVVAVGWNSERFDGRNLALRLAALGYTQVYWYRGGREAWEVNGLPETQVAATPW